MGRATALRKLRVLFAAVVLATLVVGVASAKTGPDGRVRVIFVGEIAGTNELFLQWIQQEPHFTLTRVPCDIEWMASLTDAKRMVRIYVPRSEGELFDKYDVSIFEDFTPDVMKIEQINWFQEAVRKGMGLGLVEFCNWGGTNDIEKWMAMKFYDLFPAKVVLNNIPGTSGRTFYRIMNKKGPLNLPGIESVALNAGHHGDIVPRLDSTVEAVWKGRRTPAVVTRTYERGHVLQVDHGWDNIPGTSRVDYRYMMDFIYNQIYYMAGLPYPKDLDLVHLIRERFVSYQQRRKATYAVIDFVQRFGARTDKAERELDSMMDQYRQAASEYLGGRYEEAAATLDALFSRFATIDSQLIKAKQRALTWIYVVEWSAVSGVSLICGFALWSVMVRRKLYREVSTTRMS